MKSLMSKFTVTCLIMAIGLTILPLSKVCANNNEWWIREVPIKYVDRSTGEAETRIEYVLLYGERKPTEAYLKWLNATKVSYPWAAYSYGRVLMKNEDGSIASQRFEWEILGWHRKYVSMEDMARGLKFVSQLSVLEFPYSFASVIHMPLPKVDLYRVKLHPDFDTNLPEYEKALKLLQEME